MSHPLFYLLDINNEIKVRYNLYSKQTEDKELLISIES